MAVENRLHAPADCVDAERLAQYAEGTLEANDRAAMESHLVDCADCRTVLYETMMLADVHPKIGGGAAPAAPVRLRSRWWATGAVAALAAAAGLILVVVARPERQITQSGAKSDRPELKELVAAWREERTRPLEGRLSGGFPYAPRPLATRGSDERPLSADVRLAAARIEQAAAGDSAASAQAALGVARAVQGDTNQAIDALERAVRLQSDNALFESDLAAAYLARADRESRPDDLAKAMAAADRAIKAAPSLAEAWFNRALALEKLGRGDEALKAWSDAADRQEDDGWRAEARKRAAPRSR